MLALFHLRSTVLSLLALVTAAVYYQVFQQGLIGVPTTDTETMAAQVSRSVIRAIFATEQAEVSSTACAVEQYGLTADVGYGRQSPSCYWDPSAT